MPKPPAGGHGFLFKHGAEDGLAGHEGTEDFLRVANVIRLNPIEHLRQPPQIVSAKGVRHLRAFDASGRVRIQFVCGLAQLTQGPRQ